MGTFVKKVPERRSEGTIGKVTSTCDRCQPTDDSVCDHVVLEPQADDAILDEHRARQPFRIL